MTACLYRHNDDRAEHQAETGLLCKPAYARLERHIAELPALHSWLHANVAAGGSGESDGSRRTKGEPPIPIKDEVHDHVEKIRYTLASWCFNISEYRVLRGPANTRPTTTAPFLLAHLEWATAQTWIKDLGEEMDDLHRTAHGLAPSRPAVHRLPAPCPTCGELQLARTDGDSYVECKSCGRLWSQPEYKRLCLVLAGELDLPEWVPVTVVAQRFDLNAARVWKWKQRGLIDFKREHGQVLVRLWCDVAAADVEGVA